MRYEYRLYSTENRVLFKVRVDQGVNMGGHDRTYQSLRPSKLHSAATGGGELLLAGAVIGAATRVKQVRGEIVG